MPYPFSKEPEVTRQIDRMRYERAAAYAPPKFAARQSGGLGDGYWLDERRYFFCVSEADAAGAIADHAKIADADAGTVAPVIASEALAALISAHSGKQIDVAGLAGARYDMPDAGTLVVTLGTEVYHVALDPPALIRTETIDPMALALHSPDGKQAAFVKDHAIWVRDRATGTARQLSAEGEAGNGFGVAPESGTNPITGRKMVVPVGLWSADGEWFVTHRIDERHLPDAGLTEHVPAGGKRAIPHVYKVASTEAELPTLDYVAFHLPSGRSVSTAERALTASVFSPFAGKGAWFAGSHLYFLDWDRFASGVALVELRLDSGAMRNVLEETVESGWIDVHPMIMSQPIVRILPDSCELIWWSQEDGYGHLYLHDLANGARKNRITGGGSGGDWMVREIVHVDAAKRRILFLASGLDADRGHRRLCAVNFDGSGFETLLADGDVSAATDPVSAAEQMKPFRPPYASRGASPDGGRIVVQTGGVDVATRTLLLDIAGGKSVELAKSNVEAVWTAPKPQPFEVLAADGVTRLFGALHFPTDFDPAKSYPLVDYIYPGPQLNWFGRRFPNALAMTAQSVAELGMVAIILETRGMPNRDRIFHQAGQGRMLEPQLSDHVAAIAQLCDRHAFLDRTRVGIFGQSGGGHATARAMFDYPQVFKVGVSVCGNHDNRNYVSLWIDKYGGRPGTPERDDQSNVAHAHKLQGKLLLIHGDMDENVHPAHTLAVSAALIEAGKDFEHLIVPGANHGVMMESPYAFQRLWNFFVRHLIGAEPPADFILRWTPAETGGAMASMMRDIL
jgi:dipeptidyl-peptidase-4